MTKLAIDLNKDILKVDTLIGQQRTDLAAQTSAQIAKINTSADIDKDQKQKLRLQVYKNAALEEQKITENKLAMETKALDNYLKHADTSYKALGVGIKKWALDAGNANQNMARFPNNSV